MFAVDHEGGHIMEQLTAKEVTYITECMEMAKNEQTKFSEAASKMQNPQMANTLSNLAQMHQSHFEMLKKYVANCGCTH